MHQQFTRTMMMDGVRSRGENLFLGMIAGLVASVAGALIWAGITIATGSHIGYVALGVGALVGMAIRLAGNGTSPVYGVIGAVLTLLGCLGGETLAVVQSATTPELGFLDVLNHVNLIDVVTHIVTNASPITYFIYAIGIYEGYKLSIRK